METEREIASMVMHDNSLQKEKFEYSENKRKLEEINRAIGECVVYTTFLLTPFVIVANLYLKG